MRRITVVTLAVGGAMLLAAAPVRADAFYWNGGNANWDVVGNWLQDSGGGYVTATRLPNSSADTALIEGGATVTANVDLGDATNGYPTVTLTGTTLVLKLTTLHTPMMINGGTTDVFSGGVNSDMTATGAITVLSGGWTAKNANYYGKVMKFSGKISGTGDITIDALHGAGARTVMFSNASNDFVGDLTAQAGVFSVGARQNSGTPNNDAPAAGNDVLIGPGGNFTGAAWLCGFTQSNADIYGGAGATSFYASYDSGHKYTQIGMLVTPGPRDGSGTGSMTLTTGSTSTWNLQQSGGGAHATLLFHLVGGAADQFIVANDNVVLAADSADLALDFGAGWTDGSYTIMDLQNAATFVTGTFANDSGGVVSGTWHGQNWTAHITYTGGDGNDVVLSNIAVPEPATLAFLALGGLGLIGGALRRRRRLAG